MTVKLSRAELSGTTDGGRYHRQSLIGWWDQERVQAARVLVVGAGALGNEVLKSLALTGVGRVLVYDMDSVELSNLSRSVLFRDDDLGQPKAEVAARRMRQINPEVRARARVENVVHRAGIGVFLWADLVICAVDNREARIFINSCCARVGRRWVDGAIEGLAGTIRVFDPRADTCYECTMSQVDRRLVAERRSCALLARDLVARGRVPNTAVAASVIAALQVQEALKLLHGQPSLLGEGLHLNGVGCEFSRVRYPRRPDCLGHDSWKSVVPLGLGAADASLAELLARAGRDLGEGAVLDFSRDVILELVCPQCGQRSPGGAVLGEVGERLAACPGCGTHRLVEIASSADASGRVDLSRTPAELGLPPFDVIVARLGMKRRQAWLFDADAPAVLGPLAESWTAAVADME